ncbi:hypothetical protein FA13DRAFT_219849 [Coprinellus micaceus]|uniref:RING-type domain-containing protein n=1 Tax=Coprinellus micaceus TaxID=71717 RepID=A0A4Y7TGN7_COPMI|nr:hypothetical protein FA13DRAFT_219849 [Coprinellus micaceus]
MLRGSKRPSPNPEDDRSTPRPKRTKSQDDTDATAKGGKNTKQKGKGKARAVVETRSPSPPAEVITEQSARLEGLIRASTSNEPTTSARAEQQEAEIARLSALVAEQAVQLTQQTTQLTQVREALRCGICFDTLDRPYALSQCGHVACYECLLRWFISDLNDSASAVQNPVATIVNGRSDTTPHGGDDVSDYYVDNDTDDANTRTSVTRTSWTRTSAHPNREAAFARPWTIDLGIHANTGVRRNIFPALPRTSTTASASSHSSPTRRAPRPVVQRPQTVSYVHKTKICPVCRATVKERPVEIFAIRNAVEGLGEGCTRSSTFSSTHAMDSDGSPNPRNPTNDPWNNVFPSLPSPRSRAAQPQPISPMYYPFDPTSTQPIPLPHASSFAAALAHLLPNPSTMGLGYSFPALPTDGLPVIGDGRWEGLGSVARVMEVGRRPSVHPIPVTIQEPEAGSTSAPPAVVRTLSRSRGGRGPIQNEGSAARSEAANVGSNPGSSAESLGSSSEDEHSAEARSSTGAGQLEDAQSFGIRGPNGVYRCIDCTVFEILDGECVSCGREYPGHPHPGRAGENAPHEQNQVGRTRGEGEGVPVLPVQTGTGGDPGVVGDGEQIGESPKENVTESGDQQSEDNRASRSSSRTASSTRGSSSDLGGDSATDSGYAPSPSPPLSGRRLRSGRTYPTIDTVPRPLRSRQVTRQTSGERLRQQERVRDAAESRRSREKEGRKGLPDSDSEADVEEVSRVCEQLSNS